MTLRSAIGLAVVVVAGVMLGGVFPAQAQQAGLQVQVTRAIDGGPLADTAVVVTNPDIGFERRLTTDAFGQVRLEGLGTAGRYVVSVAEGPSHGAAASEPLSLRANFVRSVSIAVVPPDVQEIVVTGRRVATTLNAVNAEVSASLPSEALQALPIEARDVATALIRLPNVAPSTGFFPEAPVVSINGANGLFVNYLIDGLDNNENFLGGLKFPVPLGFTRDVTVLANSYSVAYGRSANGVVNYTSPSGGNETHGEIYTLVRPGRPLDARSAFPRRDLSGNAVGESFERYQVGGSIGGPIVPDRTFYYLNLEYTRDHNDNLLDAPALNSVDTITGNNQFLLGSARLDHRLDDDWTLTARVNASRVTIERPGGALGAGNVTFPSAGSDQDRFATVAALSAAYAGGAWSYDGAVQYSRFRWNYGKPRRAPGPQVTIRDESGLTIGVVGHPGYVFDDVERTWQTQHRLQRRWGAHRVSVGADIIRSDFALLGGGNPDGNFTVELTPGQIGVLNSQNSGLGLGAADVLSLDPRVINYAVELRPQSFGTPQTLVAMYLEDEWQISPRLTGTLGVRWDYDSLSGKGGGAADLDNIAPRAALNYRPDERSAVRLGAGLFYGKLPYTVISDALQRNTTAPVFLTQLAELQRRGLLPAGVRFGDITFDGNLTVSPACARVADCPSSADVQGLRDTATINEVRILSPDGYDNPYSIQLSAGYQREIDDTLTVGVDLIYNRTRNLVRLRDLNAPAPFTPNVAALTTDTIALLRAQPDNTARLALARSLGLVRTQADADATRPAGVLAGGARQITVSDTGGRSTYRALNLQVNKARGDDFYAYLLSYTLSQLKNDTDDLNFRASDANAFAADWGPSANDRRHVISAVGYLYPLDGLRLSVAGLFQSGQPVNFVPDARIFGTQDLNGDGQSFGENFVGNSDRYPGVDRNSGRLPWSTTIDIGVRYLLPIRPTGIEVSADVFNVFNANNESGFANAATTSNQVQFGGGAPFVQRNAAAPRQFQFGVAWKF